MLDRASLSPEGLDLQLDVSASAANARRHAGEAVRRICVDLHDQKEPIRSPKTNTSLQRVMPGMPPNKSAPDQAYLRACLQRRCHLKGTVRKQGPPCIALHCHRTAAPGSTRILRWIFCMQLH
jgi:hypothetical protein